MSPASLVSPEREESAQRESKLATVAAQMLALFEDGGPGVIRGVGSVFEAHEVFDWIRRAHRPERQKSSRKKIRALKTVWHLTEPELPDRTQADPGRSAEIYRDGASLLDPVPFLPTLEHEDFAAWVAQTRAALGGEFGMQAPGLECASWDALDRLQRLLAPTLRVTGPRSYRYNAFVGDYRRTPFGFHLDPHHEAVFQFVLAGSRRGMFWEGLVLHDEDAEWVEDSNGLVAPAREPDEVFELEPGDVVFWPGTHVHGFETSGPSMALSVVIDRTSPRNRADIAAGLEVQTSGGAAALPAMDPTAQVEIGQRVRRRSVYPLRYERYDDELIIGVCGRHFEWPDRMSVPAAMQMFDFLDAHPEVEVQGVIDACAGPWLEAQDVVRTLSMLKGLGYLA